MNETMNYKLPKPEEDDFYDIKEFNQAMDTLDETLNDMEEKKLDKNGDASDTIIQFDQEILRENLESGEKLSVSFGKIKKWFSELQKVAFSGKALDVMEDAARRFVSDTEKKNWNGKVSAEGGDISNTKIESLDTITEEFPEPEEGETPKVFFGKVRKFIQDFHDFKSGIITVGKLANGGDTTDAGYALDARYGKTLYDLYGQLNGNLNTIKSTPGLFSNYGSVVLNSQNASGVEGSELIFRGLGGNTGNNTTLDCYDNYFRIFGNFNNTDFHIYEFKADGIYLDYSKIPSNSDLALQILDTKTVLTLQNNFEFWLDCNFGIISRCGKNVHLNMLMKGNKGTKHSVICSLPFSPAKSEIHTTTLPDGTYVEFRTLNNGTLFLESTTIPTIDWWPIDITYTCK